MLYHLAPTLAAELWSLGGCFREHGKIHFRPHSLQVEILKLHALPALLKDESY